MVTPAGHYSLYQQRGAWLYLAGQTGEDERGVLGANIAQETHQAIENIKTILSSADAALTDVARLTCYLANIDDFQTFDAAYAAALGPSTPARTTVAVAGLPDSALVEVEAVPHIERSTFAAPQTQPLP